MKAENVSQLLLIAASTEHFHTSEATTAMRCERRCVQRIRDDLSRHFQMSFVYHKKEGWTVEDWGWFDKDRIKEF